MIFLMQKDIQADISEMEGSKVWFIHKGTHYSGLRKDGILYFVAAWLKHNISRSVCVCEWERDTEFSVLLF